MILTNEEINALNVRASDARIVERAVIDKLSQGVEMPEPASYVSFNRQGTISRVIKHKDKWTNTPIYTADQLSTAIAASRVKALGDAMNCYSPDDSATDWMDKIRALKGTTP